MLDPKHLVNLKKKARDEKVLSKVYEYFLDHLGEEKEFIDMCRPCQDDELLDIIRTSVTPVFNRTVRMSKWKLLEVSSHQFVHGAGMINGYVSNILYWRDTHLGVICVLGVDSTFDTKLIRFFAEMPDTRHDPKPN